MLSERKIVNFSKFECYDKWKQLLLVNFSIHREKQMLMEYIYY